MRKKGETELTKSHSAHDHFRISCTKHETKQQSETEEKNEETKCVCTVTIDSIRLTVSLITSSTYIRARSEKKGNQHQQQQQIVSIKRHTAT